MKYRTKIIFLLGLFTLPVTVVAMPISYDFTLTATNGVIVNGMFTGEDLNSDGYLRDAEVEALGYEVLQGTTLLGTTAGLSTATFPNFNFNYDLGSMSLLTSASFTTTNGQNWGWSNYPDYAIALASNRIYINGNGSNPRRPAYGAFFTQSSAPAAVPVPAPSPFALLGAGILALGCARKRQIKISELHS